MNQLGIADVNGGIPYLQSPKAITDKYGIIERVWTDRRYEDPDSLKAAAEAMLKELQEPLEVGFQEMAASDFDKAAVGKHLRIVYPEISEKTDTFITEIRQDYGDMDVPLSRLRTVKPLLPPPWRQWIFSYRKKYGEIIHVYSNLHPYRVLSVNLSGYRFIHFFSFPFRSCSITFYDFLRRFKRSLVLRWIAFFAVWCCVLLASCSLGLRFLLLFAL